MVQGSGFRVQGSGFRVQGSGFRVQGRGLSVHRDGDGLLRQRHSLASKEVETIPGGAIACHTQFEFQV